MPTRQKSPSRQVATGASRSHLPQVCDPLAKYFDWNAALGIENLTGDHLKEHGIGEDYPALSLLKGDTIIALPVIKHKKGDLILYSNGRGELEVARFHEWDWSLILVTDKNGDLDFVRPMTVAVVFFVWRDGVWRSLTTGESWTPGSDDWAAEQRGGQA